MYTKTAENLCMFYSSCYRMDKSRLVLAVLSLFCFTGGRAGGNIYVYTDIKVNWFEAYEHCASFNAILLTIESAQKNEDVRNAVQSCNQQCGCNMDHIWSSGTDLPHEGSFLWMGNGQPFTFTSWNNGEPSNKGQEDCVAIWEVNGRNMAWNDKPCSDEYYVICQDRD